MHEFDMAAQLSVNVAQDDVALAAREALEDHGVRVRFGRGNGAALLEDSELSATTNERGFARLSLGRDLVQQGQWTVWVRGVGLGKKNYMLELQTVRSSPQAELTRALGALDEVTRQAERELEVKEALLEQMGAFMSHATGAPPKPSANAALANGALASVALVPQPGVELAASPLLRLLRRDAAVAARYVHAPTCEPMEPAHAWTLVSQVLQARAPPSVPLSVSPRSVPLSLDSRADSSRHYSRRRA